MSKKPPVASDAGSIVPLERVANAILVIRDQRVLLDRDLAVMYGVSTKALNQAVRRNAGRFPEDFMFQLTSQEKTEVVTNCDHLKSLKFSPTRPYAFTEQGVAMLSSVLNSDRAVQVNVQIMRTFVRLRQMLASHAGLAAKLNELEKKYDHHFGVVFDAIRELMAGPKEKRKLPIGFHTEARRTGRK
ncbi:MAG TPA: ORF6N domain-containing protein [Tepidisphaeraceae bacterium]|jgi:hypothetical protein|nr:ORF6N domain-containing protein [Tepidisphaeraceae bacterium]